LGASNPMDRQMGSITVWFDSSLEPKSPFHIVAGQGAYNTSASGMTLDI